VTIPDGNDMRVGKVNGLNDQPGGGTQYQYLEDEYLSVEEDFDDIQLFDDAAPRDLATEHARRASTTA
jgi:hypothetical protein